MDKTSPEEEILKKLQVLEQDHAHLMQELSLFRHHHSYSYAQQECQRAHSRFSSSVPRRPLTFSFSDRQYLNILQSIGHSVHIFDLSCRIIYWSKTATNLYGYSVGEALGQSALELLADPQVVKVGNSIVQRLTKGESWVGEFPVKNKMGATFSALVTNTPFYDDEGIFIGVICVSSDLRLFQENRIPMLEEVEFTRLDSSSGSIAPEVGGLVDNQQPVQNAIASKFTNLASKMSNKVKSRIKAGIDHLDYKLQGGDSHQFHHWEEGDSSGASPRGDVSPSPLGVFSKLKEKFPGKPSRDHDDSAGKHPMQKIITAKAEAWIGKKGMSWPWKEKEQQASEAGNDDIVFPWLHSLNENDSIPWRSNYGLSPGDQANEYSHSETSEDSGSGDTSFNVNITRSANSVSSKNTNKVNVDIDCWDYEVRWEEMIIGEQIGKGNEKPVPKSVCGTVYHGLWDGSDVAIKIFFKQDYPDDVLLSFTQEVSLMKRLRHPNVLLFMGAVTSPERLCIVTEFLPRGSLFQLLRKTKSKLDWRRCLQMALDIAQGMNYLHHFNPPILHRDLKSSNLLVDKNWTVKVGDFGLSRLKHETFIFTSGKGTPQWMAPEVLCSEASDEKSDVYSYGVILWELTTGKIPWDDLNVMQVIGAVGFLNQRLEIPKDIDPQWASIIESCWHSDPACRPTFRELLQKLKVLQKQHALKIKTARYASSDSTRKES